jgi:hypothetical protein
MRAVFLGLIVVAFTASLVAACACDSGDVGQPTTSQPSGAAVFHGVWNGKPSPTQTVGKAHVTPTW